MILQHKKTYAELTQTIADNHELFDMLTDLAWFKTWLLLNQRVYHAFERYAIDLHNSGRRKRYSVWMIGNRLRWDSLLAEEGSEYKLSNNSFAYISRLVMTSNPALDGMFAIKGRPDEDTL